VLVSACVNEARPVQITLVADTPNPSIELRGFGRSELDAIGRANLTQEQWVRLMRVSVKGGSEGLPPVAGSYSIERDAIRFTPMFPLDAGREYAVTFDPSQAPGKRVDGPVVTALVSRPAEPRVPSTVVDCVYPSGDVLPENQLRMYIHFSAPMGLKGGLDYIRLIDERGQEVVDPFLPLDAEFWNTDHTRYTVFFDPGRVKRGILPNQQMGRALAPGHRYTLEISADWRDAHGLPLKSRFTREFRAGPADERPLDSRTWRIAAPAAGTSAPLAVSFPEPLDHGLLMRALGVSRASAAVEGESRVEDAERRWTFTPRDPWEAGEYQLVVLSFLEDLAGNRIGRAFEVDTFDRVDTTSEPERHLISFRVASR
jgi:hypothetical protein